MDIRRISSEEGLPVSLEDLREDLRFDDDDDDGTLTRMAQTAAGLIERRSGYVLIPGTFEATPTCLEPWTIMRSPFRSLDSLQAMTGKNAWTDLDLDDFHVIERGRGFEIAPFPSFTPPTLYVGKGSLRIRFSAGFDLAPTESGASGDDDHPIDPTVRGVFIALVGHYVKNRELFEADKLTEIESTAGGLLNSIRTFW